MENALQGKTALVTGSARRLGRVIALALARKGVNLVLHYHASATEAKALLAETRNLKVQVWPLAADFNKPSGYQELIHRSLAAAGRLDILINNASIFPADTLDTLTLESLVHTLEINSWAPMVLMREFARQVRKGHILNLLDTRIHGYDFEHAGYLLSKQMLAQLTRMAALAYAPEIRVNGIAPGAMLPPVGKNQAFLKKLGLTLPLRQAGEPEQIAEAALYLLASEFITGEIIHVDGGWHLKERANGPNTH